MKKQMLWGGGLVGLGLILLVIVYLLSPPGPQPQPPSHETAIPAAPGPPPPEVAEGVRGTLPPPPEAVPSAVPEPPVSPAVAATPPPAAAPPAKSAAAPPVATKKEYGVLAGQYRSYRAAQKARTKLRQQGLPAYVQKGRGKHPFKVWAGPFPTTAQAQKASRLLKQKLRLSAAIKTRPAPEK